MAMLIQMYIQKMAPGREWRSSEIPSDEARHLAEGEEIAHLRRQFCFVLPQALSFRTTPSLQRRVEARSQSAATIARPGTCVTTMYRERNQDPGTGRRGEGGGREKEHGSPPNYERGGLENAREWATLTDNQQLQP